jgi:hypothetical protein
MSTTTQQQNGNGTHRVHGPDIFPEQRQTKPQLAVGVEVPARRADGWRVKLQFSLPLEKLDAALNRLGELGYTPDTAPVSAQNAPGAPTLPVGVSKPRVAEFDADGAPICPVHGTVMRESQNYSGSWYCSRKAADGEPANSKGYCACSYKERQ